MTCQRCQGLIIMEDRFFDFPDISIENNPAWRCVNCGEVTDIVIVRNRSVQSRTSDMMICGAASTSLIPWRGDRVHPSRGAES